METKRCSTCKVEKCVNEYGKDRGRIRGQCKLCRGIVSKLWANSEKGKQSRHKYLETHKIQEGARNKEYRETHKETISERGKIKVTCECGSICGKTI